VAETSVPETVVAVPADAAGFEAGDTAEISLDIAEFEEEEPGASGLVADAPPPLMSAGAEVLDFSTFRFEGVTTAGAEEALFGVEAGGEGEQPGWADPVAEPPEPEIPAALEEMDLLDELEGFEPEPLEPFAPEPFEPLDSLDLSWGDELLAGDDLQVGDAALAMYDRIADDAAADGIPGPIGLPQEVADDDIVLDDISLDDSADVQSQLLRNAAAAGFDLGDEIEDELLLEDAVQEGDEDDDGWLPSLLEDEK
jgi:hypothetical protein